MWQKLVFCIECKTELSEDEMMDSDGVCPYCGHNSDSTICNTVAKSARWIVDYSPTWWEWLMGGREKGHWEFKK